MLSANLFKPMNGLTCRCTSRGLRRLRGLRGLGIHKGNRERNREEKREREGAKYTDDTEITCKKSETLKYFPMAYRISYLALQLSNIPSYDSTSLVRSVTK